MRCSFVIPSYNCAAWLPHCIDSILTQDYKDIEIVIVDDCSTDSTTDYLGWLSRQESAKKIKVIRNEKNMGRSASRNIGNKAATGDIILVLDADDIASPQRASLTVKKFEAGAQFVHGACHRMDALGRDGGMMPTDVFNREKALETMSNYIVHSTCAYTKEVADRYQYADGEVARLGVDDWEFQIRLAMDGVKFEYIPTPLAAYRLTDGISATRNEDEVKKFKEGYLSSLKVAA